MGNFAEKVTGILFGLAAGDRIGGPVRMAIRVAASLGDKGASLRKTSGSDTGTGGAPVRSILGRQWRECSRWWSAAPRFQRLLAG